MSPSRSRWYAWLLAGACAGLAPAGCAQILGIEDLPSDVPGDARLPGPPADAAGVVVDAVVAAPDADLGPPPRPRDVVHVPEENWEGGAVIDATWAGNVTIDTSAPSISGEGTEALTITHVAQAPSGPGLAVLHVGNLTVNAGVEVRVAGERPLVIISSGSITLNGVIDAGAAGQTPGAGGAGPGEGAGQGVAGTHLDGQANDSGGSGAGHGTPGADGGHGCTDPDFAPPRCGPADAAQGQAGGPAYGDAQLTELTGGSGGGRGGEGEGSCPGGAGGAGGGAVQLYASATITIGASGGISVGGGGGRGGETVAGEDVCNASAAGGGGSGGAVYLQAARIELAGTLAANGGGGGAGATGGSDNTGASGADGALSANPAPGGPDNTDGGSAGGAGGAGTTAPTPGVEDDPNGGGGGGAVGYIVLHCTEFEGTGITSPAPFRTPGCS